MVLDVRLYKDKCLKGDMLLCQIKLCYAAKNAVHVIIIYPPQRIAQKEWN